jgi:hypothetical protein
MATKKPRAKKPPKKKAVAAKMAETVIREDATQPAAPAPVLVNAIEPDEQLSDSSVDTLVQTWEKSFEAAMPVARAVNRKLVDIAQTNMNSSLELARDLAGAKTPMEAMRLGMNYWHEHMGVLEAQAQELRSLSAEFVATASEPLRAHMRRT